MQAFESPRTFPWLFRRFVRPSAALGALFLVAALAGADMTRHIVSPPPVYAACQSANGNCTPSDKTAVADVAYYIPGSPSVTAVEPNSATSWTITAYWGLAPGGGADCSDYTESATVDVAWNGSSWVLSNVNTTTHITSISVCALVTCNSHSSSYRLYVNVLDPINVMGIRNLRQVIFAATSVPNGTDHDGVCSAGTSHTPTASSFSGTDSGGFECTYDCSQTGTNVNITYN